MGDYTFVLSAAVIRGRDLGDPISYLSTCAARVLRAHVQGYIGDV